MESSEFRQSGDKLIDRSAAPETGVVGAAYYVMERLAGFSVETGEIIV